MDLKKHDTRAGGEAGADMHVRDPDDELVYQDVPKPKRGQKAADPKPVTIRVRGSDSPTFRTVDHRVNGTSTLRVKRGGVRIDNAEAERKRIEVMAGCTISWDGIEEDGAPLECTVKTAIRVYTAYPWLGDQVSAFMDDRTNFLGG